MIKKILFKEAKKEMIDDRERIISQEKMYFIEDISKEFHTSDGTFSKDDLAKSNTKIKSGQGQEFSIINASFIDSFKGIKKIAQTIPLKDLGFILAETGIDKKWTAIDAGSGSGAAACFLARYVKKVYSYDISDSNLEQSKKNSEYFGLKNIVFKKQSVYEKIPNKNVDLIILDLPEPWKAMQNAYNALKVGGFLITYCPQITQAQKCVNTAEINHGFLQIKTVEIIERDWKIEGLIVRPKSLSNIHSGFITIMRKII